MRGTVYQTKNDMAYSILKARILEGAILPGERLTVSQYTKELEMSAMPIREALKRLQQEGLVTIIPHVGAQVTKYNERQFEEITQVRSVLEPYAARMAAERLTGAQLNELENILHKMDLALSENEIVAFSELNSKFHAAIYSRCGNEMLLALVMQLWEKSDVSKNIFLIEGGRANVSQQEHWRILQLLRERNGEAVELELRRHKNKSFGIVARNMSHTSPQK